MTVCFFNRSYWPDTGATGQLLTELAEDLVAHHGMEVTVVTGHPISGGVKLPNREVRNGVTIIRVAGTVFSPRAFAGRATNYVTYFISALFAARRLPPSDVIVALTDPPIVGCAALAARRRGGFVFYCQDIFPEVAALLQDFRSDLVDAALERVNRFLVRRASLIVALGDTMARRLVVGKGADPAKVFVIHNWADTTAISPEPQANAFSRAHGLVGKFVVMHAGNIGQSQNLDTVLDAADVLRRDADIVFVFIGDGTRRADLEASARARGLTNVRFLPFQPRDMMRWSYATASAFIVSLRPGLAGYIVPSKLYGVLAAGRPYIAAVDEQSEVAIITQQHECGICVPPGDASAMADAIRRLKADQRDRERMGVRARAASVLFDRARQVGAHAAVLTRAAEMR